MMDELRPYPEYKESELPWLGQIPAHWDIGRNGRLFSQRNENGFSELPILEVSLRTGVRVRDMENLKRKQMMSDRDKYKRAALGDIAYNMMRMWQGAVGVAPVDGLVSPAYVVARPYSETEPRYFAYLFRTNAYMNEVDGYSRGIVKDRNRLYWQDFKRMPSCMPPYEEQKIIADYLDANAIKVRRFIRNRRRMIEVLNEQKQAIINQAVTRGLDPSIHFRCSDIEWIDEIPKHWEKMRLRNLSELRVSNVDKHSKDGEITIRLCNYTDVYKNPVITNDMPFMVATATPEEIAAYNIQVGDVLITKDSEDWQDIGVPSVVIETADDLVCGYHLAILRPKTDLTSGHFLIYALQCCSAVTQLNLAAKGVTRFGLSQGAIKSLYLPVPPVDEQKKIVLYIEDATTSISGLIRRTQREIDLIQEYRTRLITDVVTGKLDVRHLSPKIETEPAEPIGIDEDIDDREFGDEESEIDEESLT